MARDKRDLLDVLKAELRFLENCGYRKRSWRPQFIFEDSPSRLKYGNPQQSELCSDCVLMQLVPADRREEKFPCRYIRFFGAGRDFPYGSSSDCVPGLCHWSQHAVQE
jgi:hypothetical protein